MLLCLTYGALVSCSPAYLCSQMKTNILEGDLPVVVRCNFQAEIFFWASYLRDYHVTAVFVFVCTRLLSQTLEVMNYCKPIQQRAQ